ncbi:Stk1 family PASTA domain-containing Ser/Thr kinase [Nocardiopsis rhodophaea]|uniref:non-specific serine/threonine protein kinase n=1 Tax=Nocardiopsis rhodophaea TaxID=280238 RepID=A0ABN2SGM9_9ACTN
MGYYDVTTLYASFACPARITRKLTFVDMTTADPLVGATLDRRYFVESRIAGGGMATVYIAHDQRLDRRVALKVMHPSLAQDPQFVRRFINEAHSVAKLSHPNVVQVFDQGTDQGHVFLAMEYVPGRTLRDLLEERGRLAPDEALQVMSQVLGALGAAHRAGLVHRDIKPENVLLTADGRAKVADFGLARAVESAHQGMTKTGTLMGTAAYIAPEQIERGSSDTRTDVYAAGIMLYELLTGAQPHTGETPIAVAYQHVNQDVPRPSAAIPGIPPEIDALVTKATERDPRYRPGDAGQFLSAVLRVHNGGAPAFAETAVIDTGQPSAGGPARRNGTAPVPGGNDTVRVELGSGGYGGYGDDDDDGRRGPGKKKYLLVATAAVLALVLLGAGWWVLDGRYETVPNIIGKDQNAATDDLRALGLQIEVSDDPVYSTKADEGKIAETSPEVGSNILREGTVTVSLSKGPQTVEMPSVVGDTEANAKKALEDAGFGDVDVEQKDSYDQPPGTVLAVDPEEGADADREETVTLTVSKGFDVPKVVGLVEDAARAELDDKGLEVKVETQPSDDIPKGEVIKQSPDAGTIAGAGDTVTITVSSGKEQIEIPDVRGMKVKQAKKKLEKLGFKVEVTRILGANRVDSYTPTGTAEKGTEIELITSPFAPREPRGDRDDD